MVGGKCHCAVLTMTKVGALWELCYHENWGLQKGRHGKSSLILCGFYQQRASPATTRLFVVDCIYVENACKWSKSPIFYKECPTSCWVILGLWNNYPHTYMNIKDKISLLKLEVLKEDFTTYYRINGNINGIAMEPKTPYNRCEETGIGLL